MPRAVEVFGLAPLRQVDLSRNVTRPCCRLLFIRCTLSVIDLGHDDLTRGRDDSKSVRFPSSYVYIVAITSLAVLVPSHYWEDTALFSDKGFGRPEKMQRRQKSGSLGWLASKAGFSVRSARVSDTMRAANWIALGARDNGRSGRALCGSGSAGQRDLSRPGTGSRAHLQRGYRYQTQTGKDPANRGGLS